MLLCDKGEMGRVILDLATFDPILRAKGFSEDECDMVGATRIFNRVREAAVCLVAYCHERGYFKEPSKYDVAGIDAQFYLDIDDLTERGRDFVVVARTRLLQVIDRGKRPRDSAPRIFQNVEKFIEGKRK